MALEVAGEGELVAAGRITASAGPITAAGRVPTGAVRVGVAFVHVARLDAARASGAA
ncbi:hypothetical protein [Actinomadura sp. WMMB 499]|uniref:hypothetical protein n=1 Tax=Actinomadura sp. WMMB 499 TaxID=1219491 RepID=UPI00159DA4DC|nr:hypothetical protein [Actinomadura sp. WMMB 499]